MAIAVRVSDELLKRARTRARVVKRSVAGQIEYWAQIGEIAEDNPDLPFAFIRDILIGRGQSRENMTSKYVFGEGK